MPAPIFRLPATGVDPKLTTKQLLESNVNAVLSALYGEIATIATGLNPRGGWDALSGAFPSGSKKGDYWIVSDAGTIDGQGFIVGDWVVALVNNASTSTYAENWFRADYSTVTPKEYATIADLALADDAIDGMTKAVVGGFNGEREYFTFVANGTLTADGALVVDGVGGQWVSKRTVFIAPSDLEGDIRSGFAAGSRFNAGEFEYEVLPAGTASEDIHITSAGGTLFKLLPTASGHYNFAGMNPAADGVTDDYPKWKALYDSVTTQNNDPALSQSLQERWVRGPSIYMPDGDYYFGQTVYIKKQMKWFGDHSGEFNSPGPRIWFPANTIGIVFEPHNVQDGNIISPTTTAGNACIFQGIEVVGGGGTGLDSHGLWVRQRMVLKNFRVTRFAGNGLHVVGYATSQDKDLTGSTNMAFAESYTVHSNHGWGKYVQGADANAMTFINGDASHNGRGGVFNATHHVNTYIGCHASNNGLKGLGGNSNTQSSIVTHAGKLYTAHPDASEAEYVSIEPGTDASVWVECPWGAGSAVPWGPGNPEGTYFWAFAYYNNTGGTTYIGCYSEGFATGIWTPKAILLGGQLTNRLKGPYLSPDNTTDAVVADSALIRRTSGANLGKVDLNVGSYGIEIEGPGGHDLVLHKPNATSGDSVLSGGRSTGFDQRILAYTGSDTSLRKPNRAHFYDFASLT